MGNEFDEWVERGIKQRHPDWFGVERVPGGLKAVKQAVKGVPVAELEKQPEIASFGPLDVDVDRLDDYVDEVESVGFDVGE